MKYFKLISYFLRVYVVKKRKQNFMDMMSLLLV